MNMRIGKITILILAGLAAVTGTLHAVWLTNGTPVCQEAGDQMYVESVPDGAGGAFITWQDGRGGDDDVYAQRLDADGHALWSVGGVPVCDEAANQRYPRLIADGSGGIIVSWADDRDDENDVYAQRLDANGNRLWTSAGVPVTQAAGWQSDQWMTTDGAGGAILSWTDNRTGDPNDRDIYVQRVDASGVVRWTPDGVAICTPWNWMQASRIASDGAGGAFMTWMDLRTGGQWRIYAQRVNAAGVPQWTADGIAICAAYGDQVDPEITASHPGEAIIAWYTIYGGSGVWAQRVDTTGTVHWATNGVPVYSGSGNQRNYPELIPDGLGGAVITWPDLRNGNYDVFAQRIDTSGSTRWTADGVAICTASGDQDRPQIVTDGERGAIVGWLDLRDDAGDVYSQWVDSTGVVRWAADGVTVCAESGEQNHPRLVPDGAGGVIVAWHDARGGDVDIYALRVKSVGHWFEPEPAIVSIADIPEDEGGWVRLAFQRSSLDDAGETTYPVAGYDVHRRVDDPALIIRILDAKTPGSDRITLADRTFCWVTGTSTAPPPGVWEVVGSVPALQEELYTVVVPTVADSAEAFDYSVYCISAETTTPSVYHYSAADSGYSLDNLAPAAPTGIAVAYNAPGGNQLNWDPAPESDFHYYCVYRDLSADFDPDTLSPVHCTVDNEWLDPVAEGYRYSYKVTTSDDVGNESGPGVPTTVTGAGRPADPPVARLYQNVPNPCNPTTTIRFDLPQRTHVRLSIYDVTGRVVVELVDDELVAGTKAISWDGKDRTDRKVSSGVYLYRLETPVITQSRKLVLVR